MPADAGRHIMAASASIRSTRRSARSCSSTRPTSRSTRRASWSGLAECRASVTTRLSSCAQSCPTKLSPTLRKNPSFGVEVDAMPGRLRVLGIDEGTVGPLEVREVLLGDKPIKKLFSKEQRAVLRRARARGPRHERPVDPRADHRVQAQVEARGLPPEDRRRALELPRRVAHPRAVDEVPARRGVPGRGREPRRFSASKGIETSGEQTTKTRTALEFFASELKSLGQSA